MRLSGTALGTITRLNSKTSERSRRARNSRRPRCEFLERRQLLSTIAPAVTTETPAPGAGNAYLLTTATATFNQSVESGTITFTLTGGGATVGGKVSYNSTTHTASFTPNAALSYDTTYTATVRGATNSAVVAMAAPFSWSFTTDCAAAEGDQRDASLKRHRRRRLDHFEGRNSTSRSNPQPSASPSLPAEEPRLPELLLSTARPTPRRLRPARPGL